MAQEQQKKNNSRRSRSGGASRRRGSANRNTSNAGSFKGQATAPQQDDVLIAPPKYRKGSMRITPLGGLGEIGRNMNVIEYNGHLLLIDCGVLFPEEEQPGVDLILPDFSYIKNRLDKVDALVLTHGHEDHIGGVPYLLKLRPDIPLIGCNEGELLYMYNIVKPKCAMPIHGENRHLVANGLIAVKTGVDPKNVVLAEDGDVVDLYHGQAAVVGSVPCGYVYVDGDSVGEITDEELEKRRILGTEGFVSSFVVVDTEASEVVTGPKIFLNAVAEDESEFDKIRHQIVEQLQDAMMQGTKDTHRLQQIMRRTLGGWIARQLHRKPMIVPVVADIAQDIIEEPSK